MDILSSSNIFSSSLFSLYIKSSLKLIMLKLKDSILLYVFKIISPSTFPIFIKLKVSFSFKINILGYLLKSIEIYLFSSFKIKLN